MQKYKINYKKYIDPTDEHIDPLAEVKKSKHYKKYSEEARCSGRLSIEVYEARKAFGMSQQELARQAETTQAVISRVEYADVNVGFWLLNRIAKVLKFNSRNWSRIFN